MELNRLPASRSKEVAAYGGRDSVDISTIYSMRRSGATLQQIADRIGRTKERVRQILAKNCGTTKGRLVSTEQLCRLAGTSRNQVMRLYECNIISPAVARRTRTRLFLLWTQGLADQVTSYFQNNRLCKICRRAIPNGRWNYCSVECLNEGHKYCYQSVESRQRHLERVRRYKEKQQRLAQLRHRLEQEPESLGLNGAAARVI